MSNRQIQPVRPRDIQVIRQSRQRSVLGQVWSVALQPNSFFQVLPQAPSGSRQWFWVALLILALNGFSAVRQEALSTGGASTPDISPISQPSSDFSGKGGFSVSPGGGGVALQPGGFPGDPNAGLDGSATDSGGPAPDISSTWVTALISAVTILVGWFVLAVILCEVPLFNGVRPSFNQNLQIAIWTTVPLGIMAGLQVIYMAAGGKPGSDGISGLLAYWKGYNDLSPFMRSLLLSLTSRFTVFWIWTLVLIYIGGRQALNGKPWAVALVVIVWALILVVVPVLTGSISAPVVAGNDMPEPITLPTDNLPGDNGVVPESTLDPFSTIEPDSELGTSPEATFDANAPVDTSDFVIPTLGEGTTVHIQQDSPPPTDQPSNIGGEATTEALEPAATP